MSFRASGFCLFTAAFPRFSLRLILLRARGSLYSARYWRSCRLFACFASIFLHFFASVRCFYWRSYLLFKHLASIFLLLFEIFTGEAVCFLSASPVCFCILLFLSDVSTGEATGFLRASPVSISDYSAREYKNYFPAAFFAASTT